MSLESRYVYDDADDLARAAAEKLFVAAGKSVAERGVFTVALGGGSTPRKLYTLLATDPAYRGFPWGQTHFFFGDERHVPPNHLDSNYLMASTTLFSTGLAPVGNIHRIRAELPDAKLAAADYEIELHTFFGQDMRLGDFPRFDVILLGMGPDGHTASLFPGSKGLEEKTRWVISNWVEKFNTDRITFTFPVLNSARAVYLAIAGADKTKMMHEVLDPDSDELVYPVQRVQPVDGEKIWLLDRAAAAELPKTY